VFNTISDTSCYLGVSALSPSANTLNYKIAVQAAGETSYTERGQGAFAPRATMDGTISG
jgi:hypothetical protein